MNQVLLKNSCVSVVCGPSGSGIIAWTLSDQTRHTFSSLRFLHSDVRGRRRDVLSYCGQVLKYLLLACGWAEPQRSSQAGCVCVALSCFPSV